MIALTTSQASAFAADACAAIENSHDASWNLIRKRGVIRSQWEAWFVAHLCAAMPHVAKAWQLRIKAINPRLRLSVSSVFTHQSPYVRWTTGRCELADLLVAFIDRRAKSGHATLIQAKQADGNPVKLRTKSEQLQFHLLSSRPIFDVDAANAPTNVDLPVKRSGHDKGILYGVNPPKDAGKNPPPWRHHRWETGGGLATAPVVNQVSVAKCLADTLVDQLQGKGGWDFALPPAPHGDWRHFISPRDDWAMTINYLLETTFKKPLKSFSKVITQPDRGRDVSMFMRTGPVDRPAMAFYNYAPEDVLNGAPLDWIAPAVDGPEWDSTPDVPNHEEGGGAGDGGDRDDQDEYEAENGPISAIVFEISEDRNREVKTER